MGPKKISEKIGFTQTEIKVLLFLFCVLLLGVILKSFFANEIAGKTSFDYSVQDSLFLNAGKNKKISEKSNSDNDKNVDYKQEVLDFRKPDFSARKTAENLSEKSININNAGIKTLEKLPGIGPSTARKIENYRKLNGKFRKLEELKNVKGIGKVKFNKIKKYLYIEK